MAITTTPSPLTLITLALSLGACASDLPISERIAGVRPLAMRVEARGVLIPEPADAAVRTEALPLLDQIEMIPFLVDEEGPLVPERIETELEPMWLACPMQPIQGLFGCLTNQLPLALDAIEDCPPVDLAAFDPTATEPPQIPAPCRITGDTPAQPSMQVPLDFNFLLGGDLELTMIAHLPGVGDTGTCADDLLQQRPLSGDCLYVTQRASIASTAALAQAAEGFGVSGFELPGLDLLGEQPDPIPDADRNTRIEGFRVVVTDNRVTRDDFEDLFASDEPIEVARGDTLTVKAGQTLAIATTAPDLDRQFFPIPASPDLSDGPDPGKDKPCCVRWRELNGLDPDPNPDADTYADCPTTATDPAEPGEDDYVIHLDFGESFGCRVEVYEGDWYRTWGTLLSNDSDDPVSYNTWRMVPGQQDDIESDIPPDGRATLYYVLRDDRQGVEWFWFHVQVEPVAGG
jgi:hypothetical protein